jgi:hypothetical protein
VLEISLRLDSAPLPRLPIPGFEIDRVGDSSRSQCEVAAPKLAAQGINLGLYEPTSKDVNEENLGARPTRPPLAPSFPSAQSAAGTAALPGQCEVRRKLLNKDNSIGEGEVDERADGDRD